VMLGTLYPLFLDALDLGKISVGPPYFDSVFVPLMAPAIFLMGVGPIARWKQAAVPELATRLRWAFCISLLGAALVPFAMGKWTPLVSFGLLLAIWLFASAAVNLGERLKHLPGPLRERLARQPWSYYGMLLAHVGVGVFIVGVTLVKGYEVEKDVRMEVGDTASVGGYTFRFDGASRVQGPNYIAERGALRVSRDGRELRTMYPEKRMYTVQQMPMTEAAIDTGFTRDLYISMGEPASATAWAIRIQYKPFVDWIWGGCVLMAFGGLLAVADRRYRLSARRHAKAADLAGASSVTP
jgi:cytochrome c-type biogenesis protein CcmF